MAPLPLRAQTQCLCVDTAPLRWTLHVLPLVQCASARFSEREPNRNPDPSKANSLLLTNDSPQPRRGAAFLRPLLQVIYMYSHLLFKGLHSVLQAHPVFV